jgi:hypothetical protein
LELLQNPTFGDRETVDRAAGDQVHVTNPGVFLFGYNLANLVSWICHQKSPPGWVWILITRRFYLFASTG